jgi:thiol-disulfide isomerase/thioredoxin
MKKLLFISLIILSFGSRSIAQAIPEMNFDTFKSWLNKNNDTVYVINFWATWCKPCVEELPVFLKAASELKNEKVKFVFVSLDFPKYKDSRLIRFIQSHKIKELVILLNDPNSNRWINLVNPDWSGAIPATVIYKGSDKTFIEGSLTYIELKQIIKSKSL